VNTRLECEQKEGLQAEGRTSSIRIECEQKAGLQAEGSTASRRIVRDKTAL